MKDFTKYIKDYRFWILLFFIIRLESINLPPLDEHAWRQCITLGVARNYSEVDATFWEPKTVICDSREGILPQEFPILNYLIFIFWSIFGEHNWVFRGTMLLVTSAGLYYFYHLIKRLFNSEVALGSMIVFAVSIAFTYGRKAMPDVFSVSLCIIAIEYAYRYKEHPSTRNGLIFTFLLALGLLSKMPAATVLPFGIWILDFSKVSRIKTLKIIAMGAVGVGAMLVWYWGWVPWAESKYQFRLFYPTTLSEGFYQLADNITDLRLRFYPIALTSTISFMFCIVGLVTMFFKHEIKLQVLFLTSSVILIFFMLKTGSVFSGHKYYIIPYVPLMSLLAGYGLSMISRWPYLFYGLLTVLTIEAISIHKADFFLPAENKKYLRLKSITDQHVPKTDRILVNGGEGQPWMMFMAHRRGWTVTDRMQDTAWVNGEYTVGLKYLLIDKAKWQDTLPYPVLHDDDDFRLYKVEVNHNDNQYEKEDGL